MKGSRFAGLSLWHILGLAATLALIILFFSWLGPMFRGAAEDADKAIGLCNCFTDRPQMQFLRSPPTNDEGELVIKTGEPLLRGCNIKICNCLDSYLYSSDLNLLYYTEGFSDSSYNFPKNPPERVSLESELGEGIPKNRGKIIACNKVFDFFDSEGVFPDNQDGRGKVYVQLEYKGRVVSTTSWDLVYQHIRTVE